MEELFKIQDNILRLQIQIKKNRNYTKETKEKKIEELVSSKNKFKLILNENKFNFNEKDFNALVERYKSLKIIVEQTIELLNGDDESDSSGSEEKFEMPDEVKFNISLAIKLVDKYEGDPTKLLNFIENINLLKQYSTGVPEAEIISFVKTRLIGSAHGAIEGIATLNQAAETLKLKFGVKITPKAIENEMFTLKQGKKTISEFGSEINKLAAKLAAAHVSQGTFDNEATAAPIVQPIAVNAFTTGLHDAQTSFFIKARNPTNLTKAISDALEVAPIPVHNTENALWVGTNKKFSNQSTSNYQNNYRQFTPRKYDSVNKYGYNRKKNYNKNRNYTQTNYDNNRNYNYNRNSNYNNSNYNPNRNYNNRNNQNPRERRNQVNLVSSQPANNNQQNSNQQNSNQQEVNSLGLFRAFNESCD